MKTLCGKTYKSKYWYDLHMKTCQDCQRIRAYSNWFRLLAVLVGLTIAVTTVWRLKHYSLFKLPPHYRKLDCSSGYEQTIVDGKLVFEQCVVGETI